MSRRVVRRASLFILAIFLPVAVFADGIVIPQRAYALPRIPG
ncbi:MAG TPA: hypothetical protein VJA21_10090 [Verrucomicrobiae bacterium]